MLQLWGLSLPVCPPCLLPEQLCPHVLGWGQVFKCFQSSSHILCCSSHCRGRHWLSVEGCPAAWHRKDVGFFSKRAGRPTTQVFKAGSSSAPSSSEAGIEGHQIPLLQQTGDSGGLHGQFLQLSRTCRSNPCAWHHRLFPDHMSGRAEQTLQLWKGHMSLVRHQSQGGAVSPACQGEGMLSPCPPQGSMAGAGVVERSRTAACSLDQAKK